LNSDQKAIVASGTSDCSASPTNDITPSSLSEFHQSAAEEPSAIPNLRVRRGSCLLRKRRGDKQGKNCLSMIRNAYGSFMECLSNEAIF